MATWITHARIADDLLNGPFSFDPRGFYVGSIAPDCNIENADWTAFTPSREVTHWMSGKSKLTADYEKFYRLHIRDKQTTSEEERAFLWGYYAHLITDVAFQSFVRDERRVEMVFERIKAVPSLYRAIRSFPETYDALKSVFGRQWVHRDIAFLEMEYLREHPESGYLTVLREVKAFPDYLPYFPAGAFPRKIAVMAGLPDMAEPEEGLLFFSREEYMAFLERTETLIEQKIKEK